MRRAVFLTWQDPSTNELIPLEFDVVTTQSYEAAMAVTAHPVEKGAPIVDHARAEPIHLSLEAFVSDTPLPSNLTDEERKEWDVLPTKLDYSGANEPKPVALLTPGGLTQAAVSLVASGPRLPESENVFRSKNGTSNRGRRVFERLEFVRTNRLLVAVNTWVGTLENMLISSIGLERSMETVGGFAFQIELTQVRIVSSQFVKAPKPKEPRAAPVVNKGAQVPQESVLHELGAAAGVLTR